MRATLEMLLFLATVGFFGALVVGLARPSLIRQPSRGKVAKVYGLGLLACLVIIVIIAEPAPSEAGAVTAAAAPELPVVVAPEQALRDRLRADLGEGNREGVERLSAVALTGDELLVAWALNENLTSNMVATGAQLDATEILRAAIESDVAFSAVRIRGTYSLVDQLGNAREATVVEAAYPRELLARVNWAGFVYTNVWDIAAESTVRPELRAR